MFVAPSIGVARVTARYVGQMPMVEEDEVSPEVLLDLQVTGKGPVQGYPERLILRAARPVMTRSEVRQVLAILNNRLAPVPPLAARLRLRRAKKAAQERDPLTMAKYLREYIVRGEGGGDAPLRLPDSDRAMRVDLARLLCEEIETVLWNPDERGFLQGEPCEYALLGSVRRLNPAPDRALISEYFHIYRAFPNDRIRDEFRVLEKEVRRPRTIEHPERRTDILARHLALMQVLDSRARRAA